MTPTPQQVEVTIQQLEMDEAEATAMRRFYERERAGYKIHGWKLVGKALWWAAIGLGFLWVAWVVANGVMDWLEEGKWPL